MQVATTTQKNTRAVKDEVDLRGYCLNCIKKHAAMTQGLLKEVQQRLNSGANVEDGKVKKKMAEVMEQIIHIEDHSNVHVDVDEQSKIMLKEIHVKATNIRGKIKDQEWALRVPEHSPKGSVDDIVKMRSMLDELQLRVDKAIYDYGCGDCSIDKFRSGMNTAQPIVNDSFIDFSLNKQRGNNTMSTVNKVVNTVFKSYSHFGDKFFNNLGVDGQLVSSSLFSNVIGSLTGVGMDIIFNPGFSLFAETLVGLGMMYASGKYVTDPRAKLEWTNVGAFLATRFLRAGVAEISQATSQLGSFSRLAMSNPRLAITSPFRTPGEIQSIVESKTSMVGLPRLGAANLRQIVTPVVEHESAISPMRDFPTF